MNLHHATFAMIVLLSNSCYVAYSQPEDTTDSNIVLDFVGQPLESGTRYYVVPIQNGTLGGGLALASRDGTCPFYVMQENSNLSRGRPLWFLPLEAKQPVISISSDINIVFNVATTCVQFTVWRLGGMDPITGHRYVRSGGVTGRPGIGTLSNWFKIEKYRDHGSNGYYKFVFCPSVCSFCKVVCGDVGVFEENGKKWLGLSDEPLVVRFKKA